MTLDQIKSYLKVGQKRLLKQQLEYLTLTSIASQAEGKQINKTSKEIQKILDGI